MYNYFGAKEKLLNPQVITEHLQMSPKSYAVGTGVLA